VDQLFNGAVVYQSTIGAWHSVRDPELGESDLILMFVSTRSEHFALLIENKIDAIPQKEQALRYQKRGSKGIETEAWDGFKTCIIAPQLYLEKTSDAAGYDSTISYESIRNWLSHNGNDPIRSEYRSRIISEAIEQNRRGYTITPDERVTNFWYSYWEYAQASHVNLLMQRPGPKPANSDWPLFRPSQLRPRLSIVHKLRRGVVDLQIAGAGGQLEDLYNRFQTVISNDMEFVRATESAAIRIEVGIIDRFLPFTEQLELVEGALVAVEQLVDVAIVIQDSLD